MHPSKSTPTWDDEGGGGLSPESPRSGKGNLSEGGLPLIHTDTTDKPFTAKVAKVAKGKSRKKAYP